MEENKFNKRSVIVKTPCHLQKIEGVIRSVGDLGFWDSAKISTEGDNIVITY